MVTGRGKYRPFIAGHMITANRAIIKIIFRRQLRSQKPWLQTGRMILKIILKDKEYKMSGWLKNRNQRASFPDRLIILIFSRYFDILMITKPVISIEYCPKCGWMLRSAYMAQELLTTFTDQIKGVLLVPSETGGA